MRRRARGFTLIEVLMTSVVMGVSVAAIMAAVISFSRLFNVQEGLRNGQASGRQAMSVLTHQLRMAGYGMEPWLAFAFPTGWGTTGPNSSERLVFHSRDPFAMWEVKANGASKSAIAVDVSKNPIGTSLRKGQIVQVVCPGATEWSYGQLSSDADATAGTLSLETDTGAFPRLNNAFDGVCFDGLPGAPARVFKIERYEYFVEEVVQEAGRKMRKYDGSLVDATRPYLFRLHGVGGATVQEPVAEDVEAFRVTFLKADGSPFTPDPTATAPRYDTPANDAARQNDHPGNIRSVRVGLVTRGSLPNDALRDAKQEAVIPGFGGVDPINSFPGYRRFLLESTTAVRNLSSTSMFIPPFTSDTTTTNVCKGAAPADGLNCGGG